MGDLVTLDIVDRPAGGVLRSFRELRGATAPGLRATIALGTGHFVTRLFPALTPLRIGALAVWDGDADLEAGWRRLMAASTAGAREHWHVRGEITRAAFSEPWRGWTPDVDGTAPLADGEPALILISGNLRAKGAPAFFRDAPGAVAHAFGHPGYLGGLAVQDGLRNTTSCSAWRTYADARDYAYGAGRHREAMLRDRRDERHSTEWFLRIRPTASSGTLRGADPFASVLAAPGVAV